MLKLYYITCDYRVTIVNLFVFHINLIDDKLNKKKKKPHSNITFQIITKLTF